VPRPAETATPTRDAALLHCRGDSLRAIPRTQRVHLLGHAASVVETGDAARCLCAPRAPAHADFGSLRTRQTTARARRQHAGGWAQVRPGMEEVGQQSAGCDPPLSSSPYILDDGFSYNRSQTLPSADLCILFLRDSTSLPPQQRPTPATNRAARHPAISGSRGQRACRTATCPHRPIP
jgi:hypothetical protein